MTLPELIDRLQKAEGPNKTLDALIMQACEPQTGKFGWSAFPYTASVDVAVAFKDRVLPEWETSIFIAEECVCTVKSPDPKSKASIILPSGKHKVPAIALVIATLSALAEHEEAGR